LIGDHRYGHDVGILVHRATGGVDTEADDSAEYDIAGRHRFSSRWNDA
jgi:hypothetical protein